MDTFADDSLKPKNEYSRTVCEGTCNSLCRVTVLLTILLQILQRKRHSRLPVGNVYLDAVLSD